MQANSGTVGTVVFRPLEAKFNEDNNWVMKMNPYCKIKVGHHTGKSSVSHHGGKNPQWTDAISLDRKHGEQFAKLKMKDKDRISRDDRIGEAKIPLDVALAKGTSDQWFNLYHKDKVVGEIHIAIDFHPASI